MKINGTPEQIEQMAIMMTIFMSIIVLVFIPIGIYVAYDAPSKYQEKYENNEQTSKHILNKATNKTLKFLAFSYCLLLPLLIGLIYMIKSTIILHPCLALMVASIFVIKGTKENYLEEFTKEYEKLFPNQTLN